MVLPCSGGWDAGPSEGLTTGALHAARCGAGVRTASVPARTERPCPATKEGVLQSPVLGWPWPLADV